MKSIDNGEIDRIARIAVEGNKTPRGYPLTTVLVTLPWPPK